MCLAVAVTVLLHLAWLDTTNSMLYVLSGSIDLTLKLARRAQKAIGSPEDYLGTADWIIMHRLDKVYYYIWVNRADNNIGKLSR